MSADAVREQQDAVLDALLRFATGMLERHGEVYPFGAALGPDGEVELVSALTSDGRAEPDPAAALARELRARAAGRALLATGICGLVRVELHGGVDALQATIEHRQAAPVSVLLPYRRAGERIAYGDLIAVAAEPTVLAS
jgi:hypothetical protein